MTKQFYKLIPLALLTAVGCFFLMSGTSSAATINVSTNDVASTNNSDCTLREAIENINTQTNAVNTDCAAGDGNNDTIIIPSGTLILAANLPLISAPVTVQGQGMDASVVEGNSGAYTVFRGGSANLKIQSLTVTGFHDIAIQFGGANILELSSVEIDGMNSQTGSSFAQGGLLTAAPSVFLNNSYIHDISANGLSFSVFGIVLQAVQGNTSNITIQNSTVEKITSQDTSVAGISLATGMLDGSFTPGYINMDIHNSTIANLNGGTAGAVGIASLPVVNGGNSEIAIAAQNNTLSSIVGGDGGVFSGGNALWLTGVALGAQDTTSSTFTGTNNILESSHYNCGVNPDGAPLLGAGASSGTISNLFSTNGGNISSDDTCSPYFTQPSDQNNVAALAASLLPLADNGGLVPTMALKEGSPAIDSGITVSGLTTDARGALRPQGTAYDSGAYESPYAKPAPVAATLVNSGEPALLATAIATGTGLTGLLFFTRKRVYIKV